MEKKTKQTNFKESKALRLPMSSYISVLKQPVPSHLDAQKPFGIRQGDEGLAYQQSKAIGLQYHILKSKKAERGVEVEVEWRVTHRLSTKRSDLHPV